ncbi:MAG TPA: hypothetical protein VF522_19650 [Ramlibacter sp.]|uniref:hypothetical protein n=1 Tax=Ramlibacter sp. TaxID=1917967 RepID=UPI002ED4B4C7
MHAAPSVSYPVGRSAFAGCVILLLALLGLLGALAWTLQAQALAWRQALAFAAVAACSGIALASWWRSPQGVLRWDGAEWQWQQGSQAWPGEVELALDLQSRLLLHWRAAAGRTLWLWMEATSDVSHWEALRRAVYSRASAPIPTFPRRGKGPVPPAGRQPPAAEQ